MLQIQEASRFDLMVRMIANAARDHGPAVFVLGGSTEDLLIADVILRNRIPVEITAVGAESAAVAEFVTRVYGLDAGQIRSQETLERALFGKNARITSRRAGSAGALPPYEYDASYGMLKFNPLAGWSEADARAVAETEGVDCFEAASVLAGARRDVERIAA